MFFLFCSCTNRNRTDTGEFWYKEIDDQKKTGLTNNIVNTYELNNYFYLHVRANLPMDENEYYYGVSEMRNDTFFCDFYEKRKIDITEMFSTEVEVRPRLVPCDIYFSSEIIPKTVCWKNTPLDSLIGIKQYLTHKILN